MLLVICFVWTSYINYNQYCLGAYIFFRSFIAAPCISVMRVRLGEADEKEAKNLLSFLLRVCTWWPDNVFLLLLLLALLFTFLLCPRRRGACNSNNNNNSICTYVCKEHANYVKETTSTGHKFRFRRHKAETVANESFLFEEFSECLWPAGILFSLNKRKICNVKYKDMLWTI